MLVPRGRRLTGLSGYGQPILGTRGAGPCSGAALHPLRQHLRQMPRPRLAQLRELRTAGVAVGEDNGVGGGGGQGGEELVLGAGDGDLVVALFVAEAVYEAAAAAGEGAGEAGAFAQGAVGLGVEDGVLVAVGLAGDGAVEAGWPVVGAEEGLGEGADAGGEAVGARVVRVEFGQVGGEGGGAARFEDGERGGVVRVEEPFAFQGVEGAALDLAGGVELAGGDVGEAAADPALRGAGVSPASSRTRRAAASTEGVRWVVKVSGKRRTGSPSRRPGWCGRGGARRGLPAAGRGVGGRSRRGTWRRWRAGRSWRRR